MIAGFSIRLGRVLHPGCEHGTRLLHSKVMLMSDLCDEIQSSPGACTHWATISNRLMHHHLAHQLAMPIRVRLPTMD